MRRVPCATGLALASQRGNKAIEKLLQNGSSQFKDLEETHWESPQGQFAACQSLLHDHPGKAYLRVKVIPFATALSSPPAIPEDARQLAIEASQLMEMDNMPFGRPLRLRVPRQLGYKSL